MTKTNLKPGNKVWAELEVQPNGKVKVKLAKQHVSLFNIKDIGRIAKWQRINARNLARELSQSKLVTR